MKPLLAVSAAGAVIIVALALATGHGQVAWAPAITPMTAVQPVFSVPATASGAPSSARPATVVKRLSCEKLPQLPGKAVTTALVEFAPLAHTPAHRHPGSVTAFVVRGTVRSQMAGAAAVDYKAGQTWFEAPRALHVFAENPSPTEPAEVLAVFIADEDCGPLVIPEQAHE